MSGQDLEQPGAVDGVPTEAAVAAADIGEKLVVGGVAVGRGERRRIDIPVGQHYAQGEAVLPVIVLRGRKPGPCAFVSAAIHGDEINGVEIIRRVLARRVLRRLRGSLVAIPVVNVYGFTTQSRYLPDRRDLNRSFPGSSTGSMTARLAHVFTSEIVARCSLGIDLHTAAVHRSNLPQVRACLDDSETARLARAFGVPVVLNANLRDGSLRQAVLDEGYPMLLYEAGEALRFDEIAIRAGVRGILAVLRAKGMLPPAKSAAPASVEPMLARTSRWLRAPQGGLLRVRASLGERVSKGQTIGVISDPLGEEETAVTAEFPGILIGRTVLPLVNEGDALFHVASFDHLADVEERVEAFHAELDPETGEFVTSEPPIT